MCDNLNCKKIIFKKKRITKRKKKHDNLEDYEKEQLRKYKKWR